MSGSQALQITMPAVPPVIGARARAGYFAAMTEAERLEANLGRRVSRRELAVLQALRGVRAFA